MTDKEKRLWWAKRILTYSLGLVIMAFGIAMTLRAYLGNAPGGVIPYAVSFFVPLTIGQCTASFHVFCITTQIIITRRPTIKHAFQLPMAYVNGLLLDFFYGILDIPLPSIIHQILFVIAAMLVFSLGIRAIVGANLILVPPDGLARTVGNIFGWPMSKAKLAFDIAATTIAILITLIFSGKAFLAVGVGTLITAIGTGPLIGLFTKLFPFLDAEKKE